MPVFAWTAKNKFGLPMVREISADTAEQARAQLIAEGCTHIALRENEVMTTVTGAIPKPKYFGKDLPVTAEARLQVRNKPPMTLWRAVGETLGRTAYLCCMVVFFAAYQIYHGNNLAAVLLLAALLFFLAVQVSIRLPRILLRKLLKALDWHRWDEALKQVDRLRWITRFHFIKASEIELTRYRAKALAGSGNLAQALKEYAVCENRPGCPSWLYKTMVADLYDTAKMHDKALALVRESLAEKPRPTVYIGLATRLLRCKADLAEVKAALAEAEKGILVEDLESRMVLLCHGIVAFREKDFSTAEKNFKASLDILEKTKNLPFSEGHIHRGKARLGCALAKQGDLDGARTLFTAARPYLVATQNTELLEECQRAIGEP